MAIKVSATYENGTLKPEEPVPIQGVAKVQVTIELETKPRPSAGDRDPKEAWAAAERFIGMFESVEPDEPVAAEHDPYLYR